MTNETQSYRGLLNAGGGTGLFLIQASAIVPGLLASIALLGVLLAAVVVPLLVLGLVVAVVAAPGYGVWRVARRLRSGRRAA